MEKHSESRLSYLFAHLYLLSSDSFSSTLLSSNLSLLSASALLCFSSVHIVGSLTSKLPSTTTLHYTTLITSNYTTLHSTSLHYTQLHYTTLHCAALRCATLHYSYTNYSYNDKGNYTTLHSTTRRYTKLITLHYNYNSTTLQLQLQLHYATLHPAVVGEVTTATIKSTTQTTFRSISGFALPSMHHNNSPLL